MKKILIYFLLAFFLFPLVPKAVHAATCDFTFTAGQPEMNGSFGVAITRLTGRNDETNYEVRIPSAGKVYPIRMAPGAFSQTRPIALSDLGAKNAPGATFDVYVQKISSPSEACTFNLTSDTSGEIIVRGGASRPPDTNTPSDACTDFKDCVADVNVREVEDKGFNSNNLVAKFIQTILPIILSLAGFAAIILIIISGIQFITSSGNPEAAASARGRLVYALVGFLIIVLAFSLLQIVDDVILRSGIT